MSASYTFEEIEAALPAVASGTDEPPAPGDEDAPIFQMPDTIKQGERHATLFRLLRSQKARKVSLPAALAACHAENEQSPTPINRDELDGYLRRAWQQADQPGFGAQAIQEVDPNELTHGVPAEPYEFAPAFGPEHFVSEWITFFSAQCDAALEFFEATALLALSLATHGMHAHLSGSAEPLRTNLYVLLVGDAAASRKTTAKDFQVSVAKALPHITRVLPEMASHEGTVEALSEASGQSALWAVDEMGPQLDKLTHAQHLAGMLGLILELYGKTSYTYKRVSKRRKKSEGGDGERESDDFHVSDVTLSIIGCCTPTIFNKLTTDAVESGLLPRFAIVMPKGKPERKARYQLEAPHQPAKFVAWLSDIAQLVKENGVRFDPEALALLDSGIDLPIEQDADHGLMLKRMGVMAQKVAMLSAAGRLGRDLRFVNNEQHLMTVTPDDARSAITVVRRWVEYAKAFEARLNETAFEQNLKRCLDIVRRCDGHVNRREIARRVHVEAKVLREIEATLVQREQIEVITRKGPKGAPACFWKWVK